MSKISIGDNIELIKMLREKIANYKDEFSKNEALVRYALIDPFLRALGWDTEDPEQVKPEYSTDAGRPDYALFIHNKKSPRAFIGAKKLGKNEDLQQHISYCVSEGVKFFIATDGNHWELYDTYRETRLPEKKITEWDITDDNESRVAIKSISIANLESFGVIPSEPIFTSSVGNTKAEESSAKEVEIKSPDSHNRRKGGANGPLRPVSVSINGEVFNVTKSNQILIKTAEWLISKGKITKSTSIPSGPDRWLINAQKIHKDGDQFANPHELSNGLYLETNYSSQRIEQLAKSLMKHFGYSEDSIEVRWKE
jgi:hypothetical protein